MEFPKTIYVRIEGEDTREEYLTASEDPADGLAIGKRTRLAMYELKGLVVADVEVKLTPAKRGRR